jgi:hypothetical protein
MPEWRHRLGPAPLILANSSNELIPAIWLFVRIYITSDNTYYVQ